MATFEALTTAESEWIAALVETLRERGVNQSPRALSRFFAEQRSAWFATEEASRDDPNPVINAVGAVLGENLARELGLVWVIATDEHGAELALWGNPGDIMLYPLNAVAKRWSPDETESLKEFYEWAVASVRDLRERIDRGPVA